MTTKREALLQYLQQRKPGTALVKNVLKQADVSRATFNKLLDSFEEGSDSYYRFDDIGTNGRHSKWLQIRTDLEVIEYQRQHADRDHNKALADTIGELINGNINSDTTVTVKGYSSVKIEMSTAQAESFIAFLKGT